MAVTLPRRAKSKLKPGAEAHSSRIRHSARQLIGEPALRRTRVIVREHVRRARHNCLQPTQRQRYFL